MKLTVALIILLKSAFLFSQKADFSFTKSLHNFGKVTEGKTVSHYFVFTNKGKTPLIIEDYGIECTCTKLEYPKYPIAPGQKDSVKLIFDTKGKKGKQDREVILFSNAKNNETYIRFKVFVETPKKED